MAAWSACTSANVSVNTCNQFLAMLNRCAPLFGLSYTPPPIRLKAWNVLRNHAKTKQCRNITSLVEVISLQ